MLKKAGGNPPAAAPELPRWPDNAAQLATYVDGLQDLYEQTRNPLYAWQAAYRYLDACHPLPDWLRDFLASVAGTIYAMALRCAGEDGGAHEPPLDPLTPKDTLRRLPEYLSMTASCRRNAFAMYVSDAEHIADARTAEVMRKLHDLFVQSEIDVIARRRGVGGTDPQSVERDVRRRIAAEKDLRYRNVLTKPKA